jgi:hypothetical protein
MSAVGSHDIQHSRLQKRELCAIILAIALAMLSLGAFGALNAAAHEGHEEENAASGEAAPTMPASQASLRDKIFKGEGDTKGYHVYVATGDRGWNWDALATIQPRSYSDDEWIGYQCVTGNAKYVVAVIAPRFFANRPELKDRGAMAYSISAKTGKVRPLSSGISLKYHTPGCGLGNSVALTRNLGRDQARTEVLLADASTSKITSRASVNGQVTSVVPTKQGIVGSMGGSLVRVGKHSTKVLAKLSGSAYSLRPNGHGIDFLETSTGAKSRIRTLRGHKVRTVGFGSTMGTKLFLGRGGRTVVSGATQIHGKRFVKTKRPRGAIIDAASLRGSVVSGNLIRGDAASGNKAKAAAAKAGAKVKVSAPRIWSTTNHANQIADLPESGRRVVTQVPRTVTMGRRTARSSVNTTTPKCAVPRNSLTRQVSQPNANQVRWAIEQATRNTLQGSVLTRPSNFANMGLAAFQPSLDFTRGALAGNVNTAVPPSVIEGVFAQESAWKQGSFRALPGVSGNPLVSDYYGAGGTLDRIDYDQSDCGYGLSQVTDPMTAASTQYSANGKAKVAVDYAENTAAGITFLVSKWNQTYNAGVRMNDANANRLENWYFAVWAYNSGFYDQGTGPWGLGWTNNPRNSDYPPGRTPFLRATYADAEHPADWPYQERIMGWMETPMQDYKGVQAYPKPVNASSGSAGQQLNVPGINSFCTAANECSPTYLNGSLSYCTRTDRKCWWHDPVTYATCPNNCAASTYTYASNATEPAGDNNYPPACSSTLRNTAVIVDEQTSNLNVEGCGSSNWSSVGTFQYSNGTDSAGVPLGVIDWHQLGTGFGGHFWFTKNRAPGDTAHTNTGTWTPPTLTGVHNIKVHIPANGASSSFATYTVYRGNGTTQAVTINQHLHENRWVSLGNFTLSAGAKVVLTNTTSETPGTVNVAFDAVAFTPISGTPVRRTIDAITTFDENQNMNTNLPDSFGGMTFTPMNKMSSTYSWARGLTVPVVGMSTCSGSTRNSSCIPSATKAAFTTWNNRVVAAGSSWNPTQPSDTQPKWLHFATPDPPANLSSNPSFINDPNNFKTKASMSVDFYVNNGQVVDDSVTVTSKFQTGNTHFPDFVLAIMRGIRDEYGLPVPNLSFDAADLGTYTHAITHVDPTIDGTTIGRAYKPYVTQPAVVSNGTCTRVKSISGGTLGLKPMIANDGVRAAAANWASAVQTLASNGSAPQALADAANQIKRVFFRQPDYFPQPIQNGDANSPFAVAPPIWIQQDAKVCADGSVSPGAVNLTDSSWMPDLYTWVENSPRTLNGASGSGPAQLGDFAKFANLSQTFPIAVGNPDNPWDACTFDTQNTWYRGRRNGQPWTIDPVIRADQTPAAVRLCDEQYYPPDPHWDP